MKNRPYYFEIKNLITQFMGAFNDIAIKRYDADRKTDGEYVGVGFLYAPRSRVIEDIINKSRQIPLPVISISINNISRDPERVFNKVDGHFINTSSDADFLRKIPQPVPINIRINMSIVARYQADAEQILSNFIPYCDPYIAVSWKLPTTEDTSYEKEIRTIIEWGGDVNIQYPIELASNQLARVTADTSFTIKGWLFKQIDENISKIYKIKNTFIPNTIENECLVYNTTQEEFETFKSTIITDKTEIQGRPIIKSIDNINYVINNTQTDVTYNLYGKNFYNITDMYLISDDLTMFKLVEYFDPFAGTKFSDTYPGFFGTRVNTFSAISLNNIEFIMPDITSPGKFDIIIKNEAGYSIMSKDAVFAPYSSLVTAIIPDPYQPPYIYGMNAIYLS